MNKYILLKAISVFVAAISQILLKKSANKHYDSKTKEYLNPYVVIGYGMFFCSSVIAVVSLRGISISFSSIIESLSYILIPILSYIFLKEKMNYKQYIGMMVIIIGIVVFNL